MLRWRKTLKKASKEEIEKYKEDISKENLTHKDRFAMYFSAFITIFLPIAIGLILFALVILLIFGAI